MLDVANCISPGFAGYRVLEAIHKADGGRWLVRQALFLLEHSVLGLANAWPRAGQRIVCRQASSRVLKPFAFRF